jgi:hypothetical protein
MWLVKAEEAVASKVHARLSVGAEEAVSLELAVAHAGKSCAKGEPEAVVKQEPGDVKMEDAEAQAPGSVAAKASFSGHDHVPGGCCHVSQRCGGSEWALHAV